MSLNGQALEISKQCVARADEIGIKVVDHDKGGRTIDAGVDAPGSLEAGILLAEICLGGAGQVSVQQDGDTTMVRVSTDEPVRACLASQYAGWKIHVGRFFAMGSGPMRAAYGGEKLYQDIGHLERPDTAVGVLESDSLPDDLVFDRVSEKTRVPRSELVLAVAPTACIAGRTQIVARSVETALHKLHELGFELERVERGVGSAPLPPTTKSGFQALGWTNDAILYGAHVELWMSGDDASINDVGAKLPSSTSIDYGKPFSELFERYGRDFYRIDPLLFSPARVTLHSTDTGSSRSFGALAPDILAASFDG